MIHDWGYNYLYLRQGTTITRIYLRNYSHQKVTRLPTDEFDSVSSDSSSFEINGDDFGLNNTLTRVWCQDSILEAKNHRTELWGEESIDTVPIFMIRAIPNEPNVSQMSNQPITEESSLLNVTRPHLWPPLNPSCEGCGRTHLLPNCPFKEPPNKTIEPPKVLKESAQGKVGLTRPDHLDVMLLSEAKVLSVKARLDPVLRYNLLPYEEWEALGRPSLGPTNLRFEDTSLGEPCIGSFIVKMKLFDDM